MMATKKMMLTKLNSVQILRSTICFSVRVAGVESKFCWPASMRARTCSSVSPASGSGYRRSTSRRGGRAGSGAALFCNFSSNFAMYLFPFRGKAF